MADLNAEEFYTLDEEKRELVVNAIQIGDGFKVIMQLSKKYITGDPDDEKTLVNIDIGELTNISVSLQRRTSRDYMAGQRDPAHFSKGHVMGNGRMVCPVLDRELISFIFGELQEKAPNNKVFDLFESENTFGAAFEITEQTQENLSTDRNQLVGGTNAVFTRNKEYIYLDDIPIFNLRMIGRADSTANIALIGSDAFNEARPGAIFERIIQRVKFTGDSTGVNAVDPISNQVIDFNIYGNDSGWKELQ
jgi:hypothetical protein